MGHLACALASLDYMELLVGMIALLGLASIVATVARVQKVGSKEEVNRIFWRGAAAFIPLAILAWVLQTAFVA